MNLTRKHYLSGLAITVLFTVFAIFNLGISREQTQTEALPLRVKAMTMSSDMMSSSLIYAGEIHSKFETPLSFQVGGKIQERLVEVGDRVSKGQVLLTLDKKDLEQSIRNADAKVKNARSALDLARKNLDRYKKLLSAGAVSRLSYDQCQHEYKSALSALEQANANYEECRNQLNYAELKADRDGIIIQTYADPGQVVNTGTTVLTLAVSSNLQAQFNVPEQAVSTLKIGSPVKISSNYSSDEIDGSIFEISPIADDRTHTFKVKASFEDNGALKLGMTVRVLLDADAGSISNFIPRSAVTAINGESGVYTIENNKAIFKKVSLGSLKEDKVEIKSGLNQGDVIITAGANRLHDGQIVEIM